MFGENDKMIGEKMMGEKMRGEMTTEETPIILLTPLARPWLEREQVKMCNLNERIEHQKWSGKATFGDRHSARSCASNDDKNCLS